MSDVRQDTRDLILAPNQFAIILDETKGMVAVYVGPHKTSLAATDRPVLYNLGTRKYERATLDTATQEFLLAVEGSYIVLENPAANNEQEHPPVGATNLTKLNFGRKVNIAGPATFPLWPGQVAKVIEGHRLRSNQYLIVRVHNEEEARKNWVKSVMKPVSSDSTKNVSESKIPSSSDTEQKTGETIVSDCNSSKKSTGVVAEELTIGQLIVIRGTEVSFYIPPTGVEVVPERNNNYVRDAVTLERLEYCILLDENGSKRIVKGSAVVFPSPTESFIEKDGERKFKAIELNDDMGIYVKVIVDYEDGDKSYKTGEELFITGKELRIYYPREEHAIIKYGDRQYHYGVVIPDGEARYTLNKRTGKVELCKGPRILLSDPRGQVIVRRVLEDKEVALWFPNNTEALAYNAKLRAILRSSGEATPERALAEARVSASMQSAHRAAASVGIAGDEFQRGSAYTPPRTLTLDTKYEGAITIKVWSGYAVMCVNKTGGSRVVNGPATVLLEYDEDLHVLELSTGKPKTTDKLERTVYLRVTQNQVTDIVRVVTRDMVEVDVKLSYRVNFEGDKPEKWFAVENYVKYLCDHGRSILRNAAKQVGIEEFNYNSIPIIRDAILGKSDGGKRTGKIFEENGMRVYDVEVLSVTIGDAVIREMLVKAQHDVVQSTIQIVGRERELEKTRRTAAIDEEIADVQAKTASKKRELECSKIGEELKLALAKVDSDLKAAEARWLGREAEIKRLYTESSTGLARTKAEKEQELALAQQVQKQLLEKLTAEVDAVVKKAAAISPELVAAIQTMGNQYLAATMAKEMAPLAILGGESITDVLGRLLKGTGIADVIAKLGGQDPAKRS
mgnify:FL=1